MIGQTINESTRTAALDGALAMSILVQNHQELTLSSAQSSVSGLLSAIKSAPIEYANLLESASKAAEAQTVSGSKLRNPAWSPATGAVKATLKTTLQNEWTALTGPLKTSATNARSDAQAVNAAANNPSPEKDIAADVEDAADDLLSAWTLLDSGDFTGADAELAKARGKALKAVNDAAALVLLLQTYNPVPADRLARAQEAQAAANDTLTAIGEAESASGSLLAQAAGETPTSFELATETPPPYYLTTWGDSGIVSITDASGQGILISNDGKVDTVPSSGEGWQFHAPSTFLLPDGTKVSFSPGSNASLLVTRGQQMISIDGLKSGSTPSTSLQSEGGIQADKNRNDGHIFEIGPDATSWTLQGATLGTQENSREDVAQVPVTNERPIDVTRVDLSNDLLTLLQQLGIDPATFDTNQDGKYSLSEIDAMVTALSAIIGGLQDRYDEALKNTATALESLQKLNRFLEKIIAESENRDSERKAVSAEERDQLQRIQRELSEAQQALRLAAKKTAPTFSGAEVVQAAKVVLNQVQNLTPEAVPETGDSVSNLPTGPSVEKSFTSRPAVNTSADPNSSANQEGQALERQPGDTVAAPVSSALRRAERLISGIASGNTRLADLLAATEPASGTGKIGIGLQTSNGESLAPLNSTGHPAPIATHGARPTLDQPSPQDSASNTSPQVPVPPPTVEVPTRLSPADRTSSLRTHDGFAPPTPRAIQQQPSNADLATSSQPPSQGTKQEVPVSQPNFELDSKPKIQSKFDPATKSVQNENPNFIGLSSGLTSAVPAAPGTESPKLDELPRIDRRSQINQLRFAYSDQLDRARTLQSFVRLEVEKFLTLVGKDKELSQVFRSDDLSEEQQQVFRGKIEELEKETGIAWGGEPEKTPQGEANLAARILRSGLMI